MITGCYTDDIFGKINKGVGILSLDKKILIKEKNPSFLACDEKLLCCVNEIEEGKISFYKDLKKIYSKATLGKYPCHINIFNNKILVCNYGGGITSFNYKMEIISCLSFRHFSSKEQNKERQEKSHPHSSFYLEDLKQVVIADLGNDCLYFLEENLNLIKEIKLNYGSGPRHMTRMKDHLYITNELSSSLTILDIFNEKVSYHKIEGKNNLPSHLEIYNEKLYVANRGNNDICVYNINNDTLTLYKKIILGGSPRHFLNCKDKIYVACQDENKVEIYNEKLELESEIIIKSVSFIFNKNK